MLYCLHKDGVTSEKVMIIIFSTMRTPNLLMTNYGMLLHCPFPQMKKRWWKPKIFVIGSCSLTAFLMRFTYSVPFTFQASVLSGVANQSESATGIRPVATGNWGCGSSQVGDPQLKLVLQWLAASVAGVPCLYYYTCGHHRLLKVRLNQVMSSSGTSETSSMFMFYKGGQTRSLQSSLFPWSFLFNFLPALTSLLNVFQYLAKPSSSGLYHISHSFKL